MKATIDKYVGYFLVLLMMIMTIDVLWGVLTRYAMGSQADWSEELARFLLIWIGILGAAYASGQKMHLAIDLIPAKQPPDKKRKMSIAINMMIIAFAIFVLIIGGIHLMYLTSVLGQLSSALRLPMFIVYAVLPVSGLLVLYYKVHDLKNLSTE